MPKYINSIKKIKTDGYICLTRNKIIKIKPINKMTVDLKFIKELNVFVDMDDNIYELGFNP